jgi:hypothetical protein
MARIRTIKPSFFASEDVSALPLRARLTWIGLWTHCDDAGRTKDNVKLIKAAVWPLDDVSLKEVEQDLVTLAGHGRIVRYQVDGKRYLVITNWREHQKINKPTESKVPPPPAVGDGHPPGGDRPSEPVDNPNSACPQGGELSTGETVIHLESGPGSAPGNLPESSGSAPAGKGREGKGRERISPRARAREATRWLHARYGLTDDEAAQVISEVQARARAPITHLIPYMDGMAEGDLADIVAAATDLGANLTAPPPDQPPDRPGDEPRGPWCGGCDEITRHIDPDRPRRCPACHPLRDQEVAS